MKNFLSSLFATVIAAAVAATSAVPVNAAPIFVPKAQAIQSDAGQSNVIQVQDGFRYKKRLRRGNNWNGDWNNNNVRRSGNYGWYKGHRGYPYRRYRNDRYHNGLWFPAGAFIAGALIGGAIANNNNTYYRGGGSSHVQWCYDRYRSYRAYDNTFQPYNGPRRLCYSPYS